MCYFTKYQGLIPSRISIIPLAPTLFHLVKVSLVSNLEPVKSVPSALCHSHRWLVYNSFLVWSHIISSDLKVSPAVLRKTTFFVNAMILSLLLVMA
jgi:hypothetical protein